MLSSDGLTLSIRIKPGIRFQDDPCFKESGGKGREVTAEDFVYGLKRLAQPALGASGWWILDHHVLGANAFRERLARIEDPRERARVFAQPLEGVRATGRYSLVIRFVAPYPAFKYILTLPFVSPVAHEVVETYGDSHGGVSEHPVGTGPFRLKSWQHKHRIVLERNPAYIPAPRLREEILDIVAEDQPTWLNFLKGNVDIAGIPKDSLAAALPVAKSLSPELTAKGIQLIVPEPSRLHYLTFNMNDPLLGKSKALRQAISSLINREQWIELFTNGLGVKADSAVAPGIADRPIHSRIKYDYDPGRARLLLAKAGYPGGKGLPVIHLDLRGTDTVNRQIGDFLAHQLSLAGIQIALEPNPFPTYLKKIGEGRYQLALASWGMDYPDAENIYQLLYNSGDPGTNVSAFDHPEMNRLYLKMSVMGAGPARAALIQRMDDILQEECPWALGYFISAPVLLQPWVHGYRGDPYIANGLKHYYY
jgi:ABC-type transport system substrate-binding protein